jgi:hypothetical protein
VSNSTLIAGALLLGFVFYVAAKGTLPAYIAVFIGPTTQSGSTGATNILSTASNLFGNASGEINASGGLLNDAGMISGGSTALPDLGAIGPGTGGLY